MTHEPSVPSEVFEVAALVPREGKTAIHKSEHFQEVTEVLALVCLDTSMPLEWETIAQNLQQDFPGLKVSASQVANFCRRYIMPNIFMPRSVVMRSVIESRQDLNTLARQLDISEQTMEAFRHAKKEMNMTERDKEGRVQRVGPTASEVAALARAAAAANMKADELLERWGFFPQRQEKKSGVEVNVNVNAGQNAMSRLSGSSPIIDAEPVERDD